MVATLRILTALLLAAGIATLGEIAWTIQRIRPKLEVTITNIDRATIAAGAAAGNLEKASRSWQAASESQSKLSTAVLASTRETLASLQTLARRTDASLNDSVLPVLAGAVAHQDQALLESQKQLQQNLSQMGQATAEAQKVLADADVQISNPAIKESLDGLAEASKQLNASMEQATAIATDGRQVADKFRETYLKPQKFAWQLLKELIGLGGSMAQMVK
jgi:hypothetical protein